MMKTASISLKNFKNCFRPKSQKLVQKLVRNQVLSRFSARQKQWNLDFRSAYL